MTLTSALVATSTWTSPNDAPPSEKNVYSPSRLAERVRHTCLPSSTATKAEPPNPPSTSDDSANALSVSAIGSSSTPTNGARRGRLLHRSHRTPRRRRKDRRLHRHRKRAPPPPSPAPRNRCAQSAGPEIRVRYELPDDLGLPSSSTFQAPRTAEAGTPSFGA